MSIQEDVAALLDTPVTILERIYDLAMVRLPAASGELRKARVGTMNATNVYELAYRKAQLDIMTQADKDGVKLTEGKRELMAKDAVSEQYSNMNMAKALESSCQDLVFELKDQLTALYSMLSWKQTELKNTQASVNVPRYTNQESDQDLETDLDDFAPAGA